MCIFSWKLLLVCCARLVGVQMQSLTTTHELQNKFLTATQQLTNSFNPHFKDMPSYRQYTTQDINQIFHRVEVMKTYIHKLDATLPDLLFTNKQSSINGSIISVSETVEVLSGEIWSLAAIESAISESIQDIQSKIAPMQEEIGSYSRTLQFTDKRNSKHKVYLGSVRLKEAKINSLIVHSVNNEVFNPESFLSLTKLQILQTVKANQLKAKWLVLKQIGNKSVEDLLLMDSTVKTPVYVTQFESKSIQISENTMINNILTRHLLNKAICTGTGKDSINTIEQVIPEMENKQKEMVTKLQLQDDTVIGTLNVNNVNGIAINDLLSSLFVKHINNVVHGNLQFKKGLLTHKLVPKKLVQMPYRIQYPPQLKPSVKYPLQFNPGPKFKPSKKYPLQFKPGVKYPMQLNPYKNYPILVKPDVQYETQFKPNVQHYSLLNKPVLYYPYLRPNLHHSFPYTGGKKTKRQTEFNENPYKLRKYKVKVIGNLKVGRILFENSSLKIHNQYVPTTKMDKVFWTYSTPQVIPGPVHFGQGVELLHSLENPVVNEKNLTHYATRRSSFKSLVLENIMVDGDILITDLHRTNKSIQCGVLEVSHLHVEDFNKKNTQNILKMSDLLDSDIKVVTGHLSVEGDMKVNLINEIDIQKKFEAAVFIDEDSELNGVIFESISVANLEVERLNSYKANDAFGPINRGQIQSVYINDDLHISHQMDVSFVNDKPATLSKVVNRFQDTTIYGRKSFPNQILVLNNAKVKNINGMSFEALFESLLRNSANNNVTGNYTVYGATMKSLHSVNKINGIDVSDIIFSNQPQSYLTMVKSIHFTTLLIKGNLITASLLDNCVLPKIGQELVFNNPSVLSSLWITGDSKWPMNPNSWLQIIFDSAVTTTSKQTITGHVDMSHMVIKHVQTNSLNNKNITFIFHDSLSKKRKNQVISGGKNFTEFLKCENIEVIGGGCFEKINNVEINDIDTRLVRYTINDDDPGTDPISGFKTFISGFKAFALNCSGGINGISANSLAKVNYEGILPPMIIRSLVIPETVQVESINDLFIDSFLQECVFSNHLQKQMVNGQFHIKGNVILQGNITASNINNLTNSDIVFRRKEKQSVFIKGCKTFSENIYTETNIIIDILNGKRLPESYIECLKTYQNVTVNGSMVILEVDVDTIYAQKYFVNSEQCIQLHLYKTPSP